MKIEEFTEQWKKVYDLHDQLTLSLEEYRKELGKLEGKAQTPESKAILSMAHHFILNGLTNSMYAQHEALIRASRTELAKSNLTE